MKEKYKIIITFTVLLIFVLAILFPLNDKVSRYEFHFVKRMSHDFPCKVCSEEQFSSLLSDEFSKKINQKEIDYYSLLFVKNIKKNIQVISYSSYSFTEINVNKLIDSFDFKDSCDLQKINLKKLNMSIGQFVFNLENEHGCKIFFLYDEK